MDLGQIHIQNNNYGIRTTSGGAYDMEKAFRVSISLFSGISWLKDLTEILV